MKIEQSVLKTKGKGMRGKNIIHVHVVDRKAKKGQNSHTGIMVSLTQQVHTTTHRICTHYTRTSSGSSLVSTISDMSDCLAVTKFSLKHCTLFNHLWISVYLMLTFLPNDDLNLKNIFSGLNNQRLK